MSDDNSISNPLRPYGEDLGRDEGGVTVASLQSQLNIMGLGLSQKIRLIEEQIQQLQSLPGAASDIEIPGGFAQRVGNKLLIEVTQPERENLFGDRGGSAPATTFNSLVIVSERPPGGEIPSSPGAGVWVTYGVVNGIGSTSTAEVINTLSWIPLGDGETRFWVRIDLEGDLAELKSATLQWGSSYPSQGAPDEETGSPPSFMIFPLGLVNVEDGEILSVLNTGQGSIAYGLSSYAVRSVLPTATDPGGVIYGRVVTMYRQNPL